LRAAGGLAADPIGTLTDCSFPVSRESVERFIDVGGYRSVGLTRTGRVASISSIQRCFTATQRRVIAARDGYPRGAPGCTNGHHTLQVHHVISDRDGDLTLTDNGTSRNYDRADINQTGAVCPASGSNWLTRFCGFLAPGDSANWWGEVRFSNSGPAASEEARIS
jgi:hypothetical protein